MKILSVKQPWAHLIIHGAKNVENRTWRTDYRGPVAIHASLKPDDDDKAWELAAEKGEDGVVFIPHMDYGKIIGVVELVDCIDFTKVHPLNYESKWAAGPWVWVFRNKQAIEPIPYKGALGLRWFEDELVESEFVYV